MGVPGTGEVWLISEAGRLARRPNGKLRKGTGIIRRLIFVLGAGLLAAGTVLATAGAAGASTTTGANCGPGIIATDTGGGDDLFLGTPNNLSSGASALLKPKLNSTTQWTFCEVPNTSNVALFENRGLALTSRASSPRART